MLVADQETVLVGVSQRTNEKGADPWRKKGRSGWQNSVFKMLAVKTVGNVGDTEFWRGYGRHRVVGPVAVVLMFVAL